MTGGAVTDIWGCGPSVVVTTESTILHRASRASSSSTVAATVDQVVDDILWRVQVQVQVHHPGLGSLHSCGAAACGDG